MATMSQMEHIIKRALRTQTNVMFLSQPALGKTTRINAIAARLLVEDPKFFFMHLDGGTLAPTDTVMSMPDMAEHTIARLIDARLPNVYKTPDLKGIIYVGEWALMGLEVSKGFQKLVNHEDIGGFMIPPGVIFVADGNRAKDRSGAAQQSRAIMSRFTTFELSYDTEYALDVVKNHYHTRVAAFLIRNPMLIDNYADVFENEQREANNIALVEGKMMGAWPSLRSWDKVSRFMQDRDDTGAPVFDEEIQRCVGTAAANTYIVFQQMLDNLTTIEQILADPAKADVPVPMDQRYALCTMLSLTVQVPDFPAVSIYGRRFPADLQTCFLKLINDRIEHNKAQLGGIRNMTEYKKWITDPAVSKMLQGAIA